MSRPREADVITGVNRVVQHEGRELHVQTEDLGLEAATFIVRVYDGGNVLWDKRIGYADQLEDGLDASQIEERVLGLMNKTLTTVGAAIQKGRLPGLS